MAQFDFTQLFNPVKIWQNMPWIVAGGIAGILIYNWMSTGQILQVTSYPPSMNVGAYGPQPEQTKTYGCAGCGETSAIAIMSPSSETPKF